MQVTERIEAEMMNQFFCIELIHARLNTNLLQFKCSDQMYFTDTGFNTTFDN